MSKRPCVYCRKDTHQEFDGYAIHHFCMNYFNTPDDFHAFVSGKPKKISELEKNTVYFDELMHLVEEKINESGSKFYITGRDIDCQTLERTIYLVDERNGAKYQIDIRADRRFLSS